MRGRPLLELLVLATVWSCLLWPLWRITHAAGREVIATDAMVTAQVPVWVQLHFTEAPAVFRLYSQGVLVWEESMPDVEQEQPLELAWDAQAQGDLELTAIWETPLRRVTEVRVAPSEGRPRALTLWHDDAEIEELLLFP